MLKVGSGTNLERRHGNPRPHRYDPLDRLGRDRVPNQSPSTSRRTGALLHNLVLLELRQAGVQVGDRVVLNISRRREIVATTGVLRLGLHLVQLALEALDLVCLALLDRVPRLDR